MSESVKARIQVQFDIMLDEVNKIIDTSITASQATSSILDYVPIKIAAAAEGYMVDLYKFLSKKTLEEEIFQDSTNIGQFYALRLREKIDAAYRFEVNDFEKYMSGKEFMKYDEKYVALGVGLGTGGLSALLISRVLEINCVPLVGLIAGTIVGAIIIGLGLGAVSNVAAPKIKRKDYRAAAKQFMSGLEKEMLLWVDGIVKFYNDAVDTLKATL